MQDKARPMRPNPILQDNADRCSSSFSQKYKVKAYEMDV